jgi:hypothetical protein
VTGLENGVPSNIEALVSDWPSTFLSHRDPTLTVRETLSIRWQTWWAHAVPRRIFGPVWMTGGLRRLPRHLSILRNSPSHQCSTWWAQVWRHSTRCQQISRSSKQPWGRFIRGSCSVQGNQHLRMISNKCKGTHRKWMFDLTQN